MGKELQSGRDAGPMAGLILLDVDAQAPTAFPYNASSYAFPALVPWLGGVSVVAILANLVLLAFLLYRKLYQNFISSQFTIHLCITNTIGLIVLWPHFLHNLYTGENYWAGNNAMCRVQVSGLAASSSPRPSCSAPSCRWSTSLR